MKKQSGVELLETYRKRVEAQMVRGRLLGAQRRKELGKDGLRDLGKRGGEATRNKYGVAYYVYLGRKGKRTATTAMRLQAQEAQRIWAQNPENVLKRNAAASRNGKSYLERFGPEYFRSLSKLAQIARKRKRAERERRACEQKEQE